MTRSDVGTALGAFPDQHDALKPARCACGELAPFQLVWWYHGTDAAMCEACWKKHQEEMRLKEARLMVNKVVTIDPHGMANALVPVPQPEPVRDESSKNDERPEP